MYGDNIKAARKKANLTQQELADRLGVSRTTITMYERNCREPDIDTFLSLAEILNTTTSFLVEGKQEVYLSDLAGSSAEDIIAYLTELNLKNISFVPQPKDFNNKKTPTGNEPSERLTDKELQLLTLFRKLTEDRQETILIQLSALSSAQ